MAETPRHPVSEAPFEVVPRGVMVTSSWGVAESLPLDRSVSDALGRADALYSAKRAGRNRVMSLTHGLTSLVLCPNKNMKNGDGFHLLSDNDWYAQHVLTQRRLSSSLPHAIHLCVAEQCGHGEAPCSYSVENLAAASATCGNLCLLLVELGLKLSRIAFGG